MMKKIKDLVYGNHPTIWCHRPTIFYFFWITKGLKAQKEKNYIETIRGKETPLKSSNKTCRTANGGSW
jgi:hypothetical protein